MSDSLYVALIGLCGVLLAGLVQWLVARLTIRNEAERLRNQLSAEFNYQQLSEWQTQFRQVMSELLAATDPEIRPIPDKHTIVPLVLRAQLMLNPELPSHVLTNSLINHLALSVCGWHGEPDSAAILRLHSELLDASRETMFRPRHLSADG